MTSSYLFHSEGIAALARHVVPDTLFAFDLDGTLAPIVSDYSAAKVDEPVRSTLRKLAKLAKVCVITGRSRNDAQARLGFRPHLLVGNHGAEWPPQERGNREWQYVGRCLKWREQLYGMLSDIQGVEIEFKGESLSIHYRKAMDRESALARIETAIEKLDPVPRRIGGKFVVNLVPMEASTKGDALVAAMDKLGATRAIYFGDDKTDEAVFRLTGMDTLGIRIGKDDQTAASYYLNQQSEILNVINLMVGLLESPA